MSYLINNQQKLNDVLFAHRNKNYGAYAIRSAYGNIMAKSLSYMIFGLGTFMCVAFYANHEEEIKNDITDHVNLPEKIYSVKVNLETKEKPAAGDPQKAELKKGPIIETKTASSALLIKDTLYTSTFSETIPEPTQSMMVSGTGISSPSTGNSGEENTISRHRGAGLPGVVLNDFEADSPPEFEGGLAALYRLVSSRLKYPALASEEGREGTVFVKFVVDEKGKVGSLTLVNNLGYGLDDEAKRVVALIPDFKTPAKINGNPVKIYYQLPIRFKLR